MSEGQAKKLRWFGRGAAAFAISPYVPRLRDPIPWAQAYACPLCIDAEHPGTLRLFPREAVLTGELTADHVPPESFGGRELVLTCEPCNSKAGHGIDAEARKRENPRDALTGRQTKTVKVLMRAGPHVLPARLLTKGRVHDLKVARRFKPGADVGFRQVVSGALGEDRDVHLDFYADAHSERQARVCWLRAGYLPLFAVMGYHYTSGPALRLVRQQIREPDVEHITTFLLRHAGNPPWSERHILFVRRPKALQCWAVQMGRYIALLPFTGDERFYDRLGGGEAGCKMSGDAFEWPRRPSFGVEERA